MFDCKSSVLENCINHFAIEGDVVYLERFGSGHINDTFCVRTDQRGGPSYLLQRINNQIFVDVDGLMENTRLVLEHLKSKLAALGPEAVEKGTLTLIRTKDGALYHQDEEGGCWRLFILLEDTKSYDIVETAEQAFSGGRAFGEFQKQLADLDANKLVEVLPDFHNVDFRMRNLREAIDADRAGRVQEVPDILAVIFLKEQKMRQILVKGMTGQLPLRITHNDTKFNNVLLDQDDQVQCVIDLDTVMPGYVAYDFGDAIRTIINSSAEDEPDVSKITLNIPLFKAYAEGYLLEAKDFLTDCEVESLLDGVFLLPYMQAVRFLTDYLNGDTYYKIQYPAHNLDRTRAQLKLLSELEQHAQELQSILSQSLNAQ